MRQDFMQKDAFYGVVGAHQKNWKTSDTGHFCWLWWSFRRNASGRCSRDEVGNRVRMPRPSPPN